MACSFTGQRLQNSGHGARCESHRICPRRLPRVVGDFRRQRNARHGRPWAQGRSDHHASPERPRPAGRRASRRAGDDIGQSRDDPGVRRGPSAGGVRAARTFIHRPAEVSGPTFPADQWPQDRGRRTASGLHASSRPLRRRCCCTRHRGSALDRRHGFVHRARPRYLFRA